MSYCKRCGMHMWAEESINYGMCENCFDVFLDESEDVTIKEFIEQGKIIKIIK